MNTKSLPKSRAKLTHVTHGDCLIHVFYDLIVIVIAYLCQHQHLFSAHSQHTHTQQSCERRIYERTTCACTLQLRCCAHKNTSTNNKIECFALGIFHKYYYFIHTCFRRCTAQKCSVYGVAHGYCAPLYMETSPNKVSMDFIGSAKQLMSTYALFISNKRNDKK